MRPLLVFSLALAPLALCAANTPAPEIALPSATTAPAANPAADTYWRAMKLLRDGKPADWPQVRTLLKQATDAEYPPALNFVALCHLNKQYGFSKDRARAANLLRLAAEQRNASACLLLGRCYLFGTGVRKDRAQAAVWFNAVLANSADFTIPTPPAGYATPAPGTTTTIPGTLSGGMPVDPADQLRASAHVFLSQICATEKKLAEAQDHCVKAATQGANHSAGIYEAAIMAAINYAFGQGVPRDMAKADEMLALSKTLARRNVLLVTTNMVEQKLVDDFAQADLEEDATAETEKVETQLQFAIAGSFADPKSKTYDPKEAAKWYELAAEKNEAWAMLSLAFLHYDGRLGAPDPAKAFEWFKKAAEKGGHQLGWANLSICYERGLGTPVDHAKAAAIWEKHRNTDIVCYLGTISQCPAAPQTSAQSLELNKLWSDQKNDAHAQYLLGLRYRNGWGLEADLKTCVRWLKKAADANHGDALTTLGVIYQKRWAELYPAIPKNPREEAFNCFERAAATGNPEAFFQLGHCYYVGVGCGPDECKAIDAFQRCIAIKPDHTLALNNLGIIHLRRLYQAQRNKNQEEATRSRKLMFDCLHRADALKSESAADNLGQLAYDGEVQPKDLQAAYSYFESAASRGMAAGPVHLKLGQMLENGDGVPVSLREAAYHYRLAALAGNDQALANLCRFYSSKPGFTHDWDRALFWMWRRAQAGNAAAYVDIGNALLQKGAYDDSLKLHQQMLKAPNPWLQGFANERLSRHYREGLGVKPDLRLARKYHDKACELGNRDALFARYKEYLGAGRTKEALASLDQAAKEGLPQAVALIGLRFLHGDGFPQNVKLGIQCLRNAADAGIPEAINALVQATIDHVPGALPADSVWRYVNIAEECGYAEAAGLREKLAALQPAADAAAPAETTTARPL